MEYRAGVGCPQMLLAGDPIGWRPIEAGVVLLADGHEVFVPAASVAGYDDSGVHVLIDGVRRYFDYSIFALSVIVEKVEHFMIWSSQSRTMVPRGLSGEQARIEVVELPGISGPNDRATEPGADPIRVDHLQSSESRTFGPR